MNRKRKQNRIQIEFEVLICDQEKIFINYGTLERYEITAESPLYIMGQYISLIFCFIYIYNKNYTFLRIQNCIDIILHFV